MQSLPPNPTTQLEQRLAILERQVNQLTKTATNAPTFWKRAWALFGHQLAITAVIYGAILVLTILVATVGNLTN